LNLWKEIELHPIKYTFTEGVRRERYPLEVISKYRNKNRRFMVNRISIAQWRIQASWNTNEQVERTAL